MDAYDLHAFPATRKHLQGRPAGKGRTALMAFALIETLRNPCSIADLAETLNLSTRNVRRWLASFRDAGLVKVAPRTLRLPNEPQRWIALVQITKRAR